MEKYLVLATFVGSIIALLFVVITAKKVLRFSEGTPLMQKISQSIRQGANAYLKRQYSVVGVFFACMVVVLCVMAACGLLTWFVPFAFLTGGFFSGLSGFIGMKIATASNCRTANACQEGVSVTGALLAEIVFTFVFVLVVLGTTDAKKGAGNFAGLAIGLSLVLVHLACIRYTGTSVNPARSIGPALFQGGEALSQLWIFIVGPFIGAVLSAGVWKIVAGGKE